MADYKGTSIDTKPTESMAKQAEQGLKWREEYGRGGTEVGVARARDIKNRSNLSFDTVKRMVSFFARHEVDLDVPKNNNPKANGYPGAGLIAWKLWGGTPAKGWAERIVKKMKSIDEKERSVRHIESITEDDTSYTITFGKTPPPPPSPTEPEMNGPHYPAENVYNDDEERSEPMEVVKRQLKFEARNVDEDNRTVELAFSSEFPVERGYGMEVLDHSPNAVKLDRLNNGAPLLVNHNADDQVGVVENARIDGDKVGRATVRFGNSQRANEIYRDVVEGVRTGISVGYYILQSKREESNGRDTVRATLWQPLEISLASIPADYVGSGVGRTVESNTPKPIKEDRTTMSDNNNTEKVEPKIDVVAEVEKRTNESVKRSKEILSLGAKYGCIDDATNFVNDGKSVGEFSRWVLENKMKSEPVKAAPVMDANEREEFSISRAVRNYINEGKWTGYEAEVSQTAQKAQGRSTNGLCIPTDAFAKRDLTAGTATAGGNTVATDLTGFIDLLRNEAVVIQAGATVLDGLTSNVDIPRMSGGATAYWLGEQDAVTESANTFDKVTLTPHRLSMHVNMSKQLIQQSSVDIENVVRNDLVATAANAIDKSVFTGTTAPSDADAPTGLYSSIASGLAANDVDFGAAPTYSEIVNLEKLVAEQNALRGSLAYCTSPKGAFTAKTIALDSGSGRFLFEDGKMNNYPAFITNNIAIDLDDPTASGTTSVDTAYYFGNWNDVLIGNFGGLDVVIDPYTLATTGTVRMIVQMMVDVNYRHLGSFAIGYMGA